MSSQAGTVTDAAVRQTARRFQVDKRYLAPVLVTMVLIAGQVSFGFLESWSRTMLAIVTAMEIWISPFSTARSSRSSPLLSRREMPFT